MNLSDLAKTVAKFAPALGAVLPIPGGAVLGAAIAAAFGGDVKDTDDLIKKIQLDPEAAVKLKQIESDERIKISELAVKELQIKNELERDLEKISAEDRNSARSRQVELARAGHIDNTPRNLAYIIVIGFFITIFYLPFLPMDLSDKDVMIVLIGVLASKFGGVTDYYHGAASEKASKFLKKIKNE